MDKLKYCTKCKKYKDLNNFYKDKNHKDGLCSECKKCCYKRNKLYYKNNPEKVKEYSKKWYINNIEKHKGRSKKWRKNHLKKVKEYNQRGYKKNSEKIKKVSKKWHKNNRAKINEYYRIKRKTDIHFRLKSSISSAINHRLRYRLYGKSGKRTWEFLPYTIDDLIKHLESQFEPWMNWNNYGNKLNCWSIDHIKPDSLFNYKSVDDKEFQECWELSNLRPLKHIENVKKGNKYEPRLYTNRL
jgi:hypothetical protein